MNVKFIFLLFLIILLPSLSVNVQITKINAVTSQIPESFSRAYYSNETLQNFNIQNVNLFNSGNYYISFVQNGSIYYTTFDSTNVSTQGDLNYLPSDFNILKFNASYINSSMNILASQFYQRQNFNIFAIYYLFSPNKNLSLSYCSIFVVNNQNNNIIISSTLQNFTYYKTNSFFTFSGSNKIFFECRTQNSFQIYAIDLTNNSFAMSFGVNQDDKSDIFDVRDVQFYNQTFYLICNEGQSYNITFNSTIYGFTLDSGNVIPVVYHLPEFISSLSIYENSMYCYSEFDNIVYELNLNNKIVENVILNNNILDNFTSIRAIDGKSFLLEDYNNNLYLSYLGKDGPNYTLYPNQTVFGLVNMQDQGSLFDGLTRNSDYTIFTTPDYHYFIAGYLFINNNKVGIGFEYQSITTTPELFIDNSKTLTVFGVSSSSVSIGGDFLPFILLVLTLLVIGLVAFIYIRQKRKDIEHVALKTKNLETSAQPLLEIGICKVCGNKILPSDVFCQNCGNKII